MAQVFNPALPPLSCPLFVPADRPERFAKACAAGTDTVIIDLEDAVAPERKAAVRRLPEGALPARRPCALLLRINAVGTDWYRNDVEFAADAGFDGVMLPKSESGAQITDLRAGLSSGQVIIALIETARGLAALDEIAQQADRLAFGSIDFSVDLGCAHDRDALIMARNRIVLASRLAGRPSPIDGVTTAIGDAEAVRDDAAYARGLGFGGKLLIHPGQIAPARKAFLPSDDELAWAHKVLASVGDGAAVKIGGAMVDAPVIARARGVVQAREVSR